MWPRQRTMIVITLITVITGDTDADAGGGGKSIVCANNKRIIDNPTAEMAVDNHIHSSFSQVVAVVEWLLSQLTSYARWCILAIPIIRGLIYNTPYRRREIPEKMIIICCKGDFWLDDEEEEEE